MPPTETGPDLTKLVVSLSRCPLVLALGTTLDFCSTLRLCSTQLGP